MMTTKTKNMYNKKKLYISEIERVLLRDTQILSFSNFDAIRAKKYSTLGIDYWSWIDLLASLESTFSKDLAETTDKFKIETIDEVINALYSAPDIKNLYKN